MTVRSSNRSPRRSIALSLLALVALLGAGVAAEALAPPAAEAQRSARRGFLGVSLQNLDDDLRDSYDFRGDGVLVSDVSPGSPAEDLGIEEGDILVRIGDEEVDDVEEATELVRSLAPGTRVSITVFRDGNTRSLGRARIGDLRDAAGQDDVIAPRTPRAPRAPRTPRVAPAPRVAPTPPGVRGLMMGGRGRLGVETHDLDSDLGAYFDAPGGRGVLILRVLDDTPASRAGLKSGDVILEVGGDGVDDTAALRDALRRREAGRVDLRILRNGNSRTIEAELGEARSFEFRGGADGEDWMGFLEDDGTFGWKDKDGRIRKHVFRMPGADGGGSWFGRDGDGEGRVRLFRDFDELKEEMSPEERERFEKDMEKLRDDMEELRRDLREMREDRRR